jgi:hypothetical protein
MVRRYELTTLDIFDFLRENNADIFSRARRLGLQKKTIQFCKRSLGRAKKSKRIRLNFIF